MSIRLCQATPDAYAYPLLVKNLLLQPIKLAAAQEIVYRDRVRHTYRQLGNRVARLASALRSLGVGEGSTVAVMDWDSHRYLECFYAVPMSGAVLFTVNVRLSPEQIAYTLDHARTEVLLVHHEFAPLLQQVLALGGTPLRRVIWIADEPGSQWSAATIRPDGEYEEVLADAAPDFEFGDFDENAMAVTFYTTGTTGPPKAVAFSHRQIVIKTLVQMGAWASPSGGQYFRRGDVYMPITPMFHVQAWGLPYVATLLGVKQVYPGRYDPARLLDLRRTEGVTYSHCVPTLLEMLLRAPESRSTDLNGWRITIGGATLLPSLAREALDRGIDVHAGYGMSETLAATLLTRERAAEPAGSVDGEIEFRCRSGVPLPLVDARVVDDAMRDVPSDDSSVGELVVRAPWLTQSYEGMPDASAALWHGGYLHTQDLARVDRDGYITIVDRLKDVIKSGGEWISSISLESLMANHSGVREVAVVGVPDPRWGERPVAAIVPTDEASADRTVAEVREQLAIEVSQGRLSRFAIPDRIVIIVQLPRTSVGKLDKVRLRAQMRELSKA